MKKSQHKYVIGPKGNSINEILAETGVFVEMPSSDSTSETITLRGPQDKLGHGELYAIFFLFTKIFWYEWWYLLSWWYNSYESLWFNEPDFPNFRLITYTISNYVQQTNWNVSHLQLWQKFTPKPTLLLAMTSIAPTGFTSTSLVKKAPNCKPWWAILEPR